MPGTALNDQFGDMTVAEALDKLATATPPVEVAGITDYATTRGFRKAMEKWVPSPESPLKMLFPNVELRLSVPTNRGSGVNIHLMCDPTQVDGLENLLNRLSYRVDGEHYCANNRDLIRLGRAHAKDPNLDTEKAFSIGSNQFKVDLAAIRDLIEVDPWALRHCVIGAATGQGDGISGVRDPDGSFESLRQELERLADVMFSGSPKDRLFWIGKGADSVADLEANHGGTKPCIHGSDAHDAKHLAAPALDRRCWLKGDATFDTLIQTILEPEERCYVGPNHPDEASPHGRIQMVKVTSSGWFENESVPINPGLVAIIGARGSGKTALADLIAAGALSPHPFKNPASFVSRAKSLLNSSTAAADWSHGELTTHDFAGEAPVLDPLTPPVRYLSQQFVDRLCADDGVSTQLVGEIERVVFSAWPTEDRQETTSFAEFRDLRLASVKSQQASFENVKVLWPRGCKKDRVRSFTGR